MSTPEPAAWRPATTVRLSTMAAEAGVTMDDAWKVLNEAWSDFNFPGGVSTFDRDAVMLKPAAEFVRDYLAAYKASA